MGKQRGERKRKTMMGETRGRAIINCHWGNLWCKITSDRHMNTAWPLGFSCTLLNFVIMLELVTVQTEQIHYLASGITPLIWLLQSWFGTEMFFNSFLYCLTSIYLNPECGTVGNRILQGEMCWYLWHPHHVRIGKGWQKFHISGSNETCEGCNLWLK